MRAALFLLVSVVAFDVHADGPPAASSTAPPSAQGLYLEPTLGSGFLTFTGPTLFSPTVAVNPAVRIGVKLPAFSLGGTAEVGFTAGIPGGFFPSVFLGGHGQVPFANLSLGSLYGVGQLGFASVFGAGVFPGFGLDLGVGIRRTLSPRFTIGAELGARTRFYFNVGRVEPTVAITLALSLGYFPGGSDSVATVERGSTTTTPTSSRVATTTGPMAAPEEQPAKWGESSPPPCSTWITDGWLSPSQAVWQDDVTFADKPGKQLTRLDPTAPRYLAELHMVVGKDTLLFGAHHYQLGGGPIIVDSRDDIVFKGLTTCPVAMPVKAELSVANGSPPKVIATSAELGNLPLEGAALPTPTPWQIKLPARDGFPAGAPFKLDFAGGYTLTLELLQASGARTGLRLVVGGHAQESTAPVVNFVPVALTQLTPETEESLQKLTGYLVTESAARVPDIFPLKPGALPTNTLALRNFTPEDITSKWFEARRIDATVAALNDSLASSAFLTRAGRVVAVMSGTDFQGIFGKNAIDMTVESAVKVRGGLSLSWKVMLVPSTEAWDTVAHELLHTLPAGWAGDEMAAECGLDYHNKEDGVAHGVAITLEGALRSPPKRFVAKVPLMGPSHNPEDLWITQCSYWHLLKEFSGGPADPPLVLMRALVAKDGKAFKGELRSSYTLMGEPDAVQGKGGAWAFVERNAAGAELGRFPIQLKFVDAHTKQERTVVSWVGRIPALPDWASIELVGPSGVIDVKKRSASAPTLKILAPADQTKLAADQTKVAVKWSATVAPGAKPLVSAYTSSDDGRTWSERAFERSAEDFEIRVDPKAGAQRLKLVVTDGVQSTQAQVRLAR